MGELLLTCSRSIDEDSYPIGDGYGSGYGQNLAYGPPAEEAARAINDMFYNGEIEDFAPYYGNPNPGLIAGHFTQVIWKGTKEVGCATQVCPGSQYKHHTVCNYFPPGNYRGQYADNVAKPLGKPTVSGY